MEFKSNKERCAFVLFIAGFLVSVGFFVVMFLEMFVGIDVPDMLRLVLGALFFVFFIWLYISNGLGMMKKSREGTFWKGLFK